MEIPAKKAKFKRRLLQMARELIGHGVDKSEINFPTYHCRVMIQDESGKRETHKIKAKFFRQLAIGDLARVKINWLGKTTGLEILKKIEFPLGSGQ